jgi:hypothetical protein
LVEKFSLFKKKTTLALIDFSRTPFERSEK